MNRLFILGLAALLSFFAVSCHSPTSTSSSSVTNTTSSGGGGNTTTTATWSPLGQVYMNGAWVAPFGTIWYIWTGGDQYGFKTDSTNAYNGDAGGLMFDFKNATTHSGWGGGDFFVNTGTSTASNYFWDLSKTGFNAYTFVMKGDISSGVDKKFTIGFGNGDDPSMWLANFSIPSAWTNMVIPVPNDNDNLRVAQPLYIVDTEGDNGTTIMGSTYWVDNVQFTKDTTDTIVLNSFTPGTIAPASAVGVGTTVVLKENSGTNSTFNYTINGTAVTVEGFGARLFKWTSSNTAVATVDSNANVTGVSAGTVSLTPSVGSVTGTPISVTVAGSLAPTTLPPVPASLTSTNKTTLWDSSNTATPVTITNLSDSWATAPITQVTVGSGTLEKVDFSSGTYSGTDINITNNSTAGVNLTGLTHLHIDYWTAGGSEFKVSLVNFPNGVYSSTADTSGSVDTTTGITAGSWQSLDIPLSSFNLTTMTNICQIEFAQAASGQVFYLDNVYFY
ncbi:MAG: hypothetical protein HKM06_01680 [Spirochaetales bacterium]|nr:hypothetical protein [Spirochaetales bacterium]